MLFIAIVLTQGTVDEKNRKHTGFFSQLMPATKKNEEALKTHQEKVEKMFSISTKLQRFRKTPRGIFKV